MTGTAKINNPGELSVTISLTATLAQWQRLSEQFKPEKTWEYPASVLVSAIRDLTNSATEEFKSDEQPLR